MSNGARRIGVPVAEEVACLVGDCVAHRHPDQQIDHGPGPEGDREERARIVRVAEEIEQRDGRFRGVEVADVDGRRHCKNGWYPELPARAADDDAADVGIEAERIGMVAAVENLDLELTGPARDLEVAVLADAEHTTDVLGHVLGHRRDDGIDNGRLVRGRQAEGAEERGQR